MPNFPLLYKTLEYIESHPEEWEQGVWSMKTECGTKFCFAGWAVMLSQPQAMLMPTNVNYPMDVRLENGEYRTIPDLAREELGLANFESDVLFGGGNSLAQLREIVEGLDRMYNHD